MSRSKPALVRMVQIAEDDRLLGEIVHNTSSDSSLILDDLLHTKSRLTKQSLAVQARIDALVDSIADRHASIKSVSQRILDLEEQKEQLDAEIHEIDNKISDTKKQVVSFDALKSTLTTFTDLFSKATPEEGKELIKLHIGEIVWNPSELELAIFETPFSGWRTGFAESRCLVTPRGVARKAERLKDVFISWIFRAVYAKIVVLQPVRRYPNYDDTGAFLSFWSRFNAPITDIELSHR